MKEETDTLPQVLFVLGGLAAGLWMFSGVFQDAIASVLFLLMALFFK